jgi:dipeptidyl aminopeptidase/acylaminoacyl peptidase
LNVAKPPVIISIHGGPEGQYRPFHPMVQFNLVELGAAILAPNVRGSTGYGKTFVALDNAEKREDSVRDIGALLDWIAKQPDLDASRVAVIGGSYGGMVLRVARQSRDRIRPGRHRGHRELHHVPREDRGVPPGPEARECGDERDPKMREVFEKISANCSEKIKSSLLVIHGREDPRFRSARPSRSRPRSARRGAPVDADRRRRGPRIPEERK